MREAILLVAWNAMDVKSCGPVSPKKCVYMCMYTCVCPKSGWEGVESWCCRSNSLSYVISYDVL